MSCRKIQMKNGVKLNINCLAGAETPKQSLFANESAKEKTPFPSFPQVK